MIFCVKFEVVWIVDTNTRNNIIPGRVENEWRDVNVAERRQRWCADGSLPRPAPSVTTKSKCDGAATLGFLRGCLVL